MPASGWTQRIDAARTGLHAALQHVYSVLAGRPRLQVAVALSALAVAALLVAVSVWSASSMRGGDTSQRPESGPRYLVACAHCGYRSPSADHPARSLPVRDGLLRCPACSQFRAAWYRRGGLAVPPGGWTPSQPQAPPPATGPVP